jgi:hypothetical protein
MTEFMGVGVGDLQLAASHEVQRMMRKAGGDRQAVIPLVLERLCELELVSESELASLLKCAEIGIESAKGKVPPEKAYIEVQRVYGEMLASGKANPTALAIASSEAGSYVTIEDEDGQPTVVYKKASSNWQGTLAGAGALIGSAISGPAGAAIGGAIGGVTGKIVDECIED